MSVRSAARVIDLIEWLSQQKEPVTLSDASRVLNLPKSSTLLLVRTLVERGYVIREDSRYTLVRLPGEAVEGSSAWNTLIRVAEPLIAAAVNQVGESGFVAVMTAERRIHYLNKILPDRQELKYDRDIRVDRIPHHVSSGLAILAASTDGEIDDYIKAEFKNAFDGEGASEIRAAVQRTRANGVGVILAGRIEGAAGVAAAILDAEGRPLAAVNLAGPATRVGANITSLTNLVRALASDVTLELARRMPRRGSWGKTA